MHANRPDINRKRGGRIRFRRVRLQTPNSVNFSFARFDVDNVKMRELGCSGRGPGEGRARPDEAGRGPGEERVRNGRGPGSARV